MINFNKNLLDLDGKEIEKAHIGKIIGNALVGATKGDALKYWGWATKMNAGEELDLDKSDTETLKNFIKESEGLTILTKAQALECFE
jgi:hypothetical protein